MSALQVRQLLQIIQHTVATACLSQNCTLSYVDVVCLQTKQCQRISNSTNRTKCKISNDYSDSVVDMLSTPQSTSQMSSVHCHTHSPTRCSTRKRSYRKDDRAMRPMHGCPENCRESLTPCQWAHRFTGNSDPGAAAPGKWPGKWLRPRLLFPKYLMGFCSDWAY